MIDTNTIDYNKLKNDVLYQNRLIAYDNSGIPILRHLQSFITQNTDPLNKLYANNIDFNWIIDYNGVDYIIDSNFFNQPLFYNTVWYRDTSGNFWVGKIKDEFFTHVLGGDINGDII